MPGTRDGMAGPNRTRNPWGHPKIIQNRMSDLHPRARPWVEANEKEPMMAKMIFVNLPVSDLARSTAFYQAIGGEKNPQFSDDTASCMVFSESIYVMLLTHDKYRQFTSKKIADANATSHVLIGLSADRGGGGGA